MNALLNFCYFLCQFFLSDVLFNMEIATYRELCRLFSHYLKRSYCLETLGCNLESRNMALGKDYKPWITLPAPSNLRLATGFWSAGEINEIVFSEITEMLFYQTKISHPLKCCLISFVSLYIKRTQVQLSSMGILDSASWLYHRFWKSFKFDFEYAFRNFSYGSTFLFGLMFVTKFIFTPFTFLDKIHKHFN